MFLRTLLFFIVMYFLVKIISRLFLPSSGNKKRQNNANFFYRNFQNYSRQQNQNRSTDQSSKRFEEIEEAEYEEITEEEESAP